MKITEIETFILRVPLKGKTFLSSQCSFPERNSLLVKITTDNGHIGWGEGGQYGPPEPVKACIDHVLGPRLLGQDPMNRVVLSEQMYAATRDFGQRGPYIEGISALDIAMWDIAGRYLNQPVSVLLGGAYRESISAYATGGYYPIADFEDGKVDYESLRSEAEGYLRKGFTMIKMKIGLLSLEEDYNRVKTIRDVVGQDFKIMIDCNHAYNAASAAKMIRLLESLKIEFLEEPVPPEDLTGYSRLREWSPIRIAGGECFYTGYDFRTTLEKGAVDILQPDICVTGGFTEFLKIRSLAFVYNTMLIPHVWGSGIAFAAALQAISTIPAFPYTANNVPLQNVPMVEFDQSPNPLRDELLVEKFVLEEGKVAVPCRAGLGVTIDPDVLEKYAV